MEVVEFSQTHWPFSMMSKIEIRQGKSSKVLSSYLSWADDESCLKKKSLHLFERCGKRRFLISSRPVPYNETTPLSFY